MPDRVRGSGEMESSGLLSQRGILGGHSAQQGSGQQGALWREQRRALWRQTASRLLRRLPARPLQTRGGQIMDRNPSPPPPPRDEDEEEVAAGGDCIGSTVYSKHWLFGVLSGLIQVWKRAPRVGPPPSPTSGPASGRPSHRGPRSPRRPLPWRARPRAPRPGGSPGPLSTEGGVVTGMPERLR